MTSLTTTPTNTRTASTTTARATGPRPMAFYAPLAIGVLAMTRIAPSLPDRLFRHRPAGSHEGHLQPLRLTQRLPLGVQLGLAGIQRPAPMGQEPVGEDYPADQPGKDHDAGHPEPDFDLDHS